MVYSACRRRVRPDTCAQLVKVHSHPRFQIDTRPRFFTQSRGRSEDRDLEGFRLLERHRLDFKCRDVLPNSRL
jgi:hypothetical protein